MSLPIDWYETESLSGASTQILVPHSSLVVNMFLVEGRDEVILIDSGIGVGDLANFVDELTDGEPLLALTHYHWDHIGNAHQFDRILMNPRETTDDGRVSIDSPTDTFVARPQQYVADQREEGLPFPEGFDPDEFDIPPAGGVEPIEPGDTIDLGDRAIEVVPLPGHSPGHVGFLDRTDAILYAGDALRSDGKILAQFDDSDLDEYRETVDRLCDLRDDGAFDVLVSGHGGPLAGDELGLLDELADVLAAIAADELDYEIVETPRDGMLVRRYEVGAFELKTKRNP